MTPRAPDFSPPFRLGELLVEPEHLRVIDAGEATALEPLHMSILVHLATHAPDTVSDDTLFKAVWKTTVYGENALNKAMHGLRKALKDDARAPRYIKRVHGRGYCVIAPVTRIGDYRDQPGSSPVAAWSRRNPFVGLQAFDENHREVFCGRQRFVERTLTAIRGQLESGQRFVFLQGPSGCGKTSLLRAGVIPALTQSGHPVDADVLAVAYCDFAGIQEGDPASTIASALMTWQLDGRAVFGAQQPPDLAMRLIEHPATIAATIEDALRRRLPTQRKTGLRTLLLLVIDHAEALVAAKTITPEQRDAALTLLRGVRDSPHALVLMNCRGDFAPRLTEALPELADWKSGQGHVEVTRPNEAEISEIIRAPALKAGLVYEQEPDTLLRLDDVLRDAAMREPDVLPLLQHTLHALYERDHARHVLSFATYREIGGLEGALARHAEAVFATLPAAAQARLDDVLARLVVTQPDSDSISGKRAHWSTIADPDARQLVHEFIRARLFVGELSDGLPGFGVAHEALLRQWPRASEWAVNNRRLLKARERLHRAAVRWEKEGRLKDHLLNPGQPLIEAREVATKYGDALSEEQHAFLRASNSSHRKNRLLQIGATLTLAFMTITSGSFSIIADQARKEADSRRNDAQALADFMLIDLADNLRAEGNLRYLEGISKKSMDYLQRQPMEDLNIDEAINLSRALRNIGEVRMQSGSTKEAIAENFVVADRIMRELVEKHPESMETINESGQVAFYLGQSHLATQRFDEARNAWGRYRESGARLVAIDPHNPDWWMEYSYAYNNLGTLEKKIGKSTAAIENFRRSIVMKRRAIDLDPDNLDYRYDLIDTRSWINSIDEESGRLAEAAAGHEENITELRRIIIRNRDGARTWRRRLANMLQIDAHLAIAMGNLDRAESSNDESIVILRNLTDFAPDNMTWLRELAYAYMEAGEIARMRSMHDEYRSHILQAQAISNRLQDIDHDKLPSGLRLHEEIHLSIAESSGDEGGADRAIQALHGLSKTFPEDIDIKASLVDALARRAERMRKEKRIAAAGRDCDTVEELLGRQAGASRNIKIVAPLVRALAICRVDPSLGEKIRWLIEAGFRHPDYERILDAHRNGPV